MAASATLYTIVVPTGNLLQRNVPQEMKSTFDVSSRTAIAGGENILKSTLIQYSCGKYTAQTYRFRVQAAGGTIKRTTKGEGGAKKSKFQTQFFKPKKSDDEEDEDTKPPAKSIFQAPFFKPKKPDDDEEEASDPPAKGGFLVPRPAFSGLQLFSRRQVDTSTVFVAGGSGQTGARVVLELLHEGFKVRAGVPDLREAQMLAKIASQYQIISADEAKRLNVVEFSVDDTELTAKAIGNAGKVVVTIGSGELGPAGTLTAGDALKVFEAVKLAKIKNFVLVSEAGGSNSLSDVQGGFFEKLISFLSFFKKKDDVTLANLIDSIVESDVNYTVIQSSSSDGVPDTYGSTHNISIAGEGSKLTGKVSKLQVASVVANALSNTVSAENKVFEVSASMDAPSVPLVELFSSVETDMRRSVLAEAKAKAEALENERLLKSAAQEEAKVADADAKAAAEEARALEEEARELAAEEAKAASMLAKAKEQAEKLSSSVSELEKSIGEVDSSPRSSPVSAPVSVSLPSMPKVKLPSFDFGEISAKLRASVTKESGNGASSLSPSLPVKEEKKKETPVVASSETTKAKRPLKQRADKKKASPPSPSPPPPAAVAKPKQTEKRLGGFFSQETTYVDNSDAGDF